MLNMHGDLWEPLQKLQKPIVLVKTRNNINWYEYTQPKSIHYGTYFTTDNLCIHF